MEIIINALKLNYKYDASESEKKACEKIAEQFQKFETKIHFKHKYCLRFCKFITRNYFQVQFDQLNFDMTRKEVGSLTSQVRTFCNQNLSAFAFITLYFQVALSKGFDNSSKSSQSSRLSSLQKSYLEELKNL